MTLAHQYAKALQRALEEHPRKKVTYLRSLREALKRRGHGKLLPRIFSEYQMLELKNKRMILHSSSTLQKERTRVLLELYHKLIDG